MKPTIICHRGWWKTPAEQNTIAAFARAFDAGLGVEVDVRDFDGELVVSHDPPKYEFDAEHRIRTPAVFFPEVLDLLGDRPNVLAVNVKACGLAPLFADLKAPKDWFFFDVAPGDERDYHKNNLPVFVREHWDTADPVLTISQEIYGFEQYEHWSLVKSFDKQVLLVTDYPEAAMEYFK